MYMYYNTTIKQKKGGCIVKEQLLKLIDGMTENQILYAFTLLNKIMGKAGDANA